MYRSTFHRKEISFQRCSSNRVRRFSTFASPRYQLKVSAFSPLRTSIVSDRVHAHRSSAARPIPSPPRAVRRSRPSHLALYPSRTRGTPSRPRTARPIKLGPPPRFSPLETVATSWYLRSGRQEQAKQSAASSPRPRPRRFKGDFVLGGLLSNPWGVVLR